MRTGEHTCCPTGVSSTPTSQCEVAPITPHTQTHKHRLNCRRRGRVSAPIREQHPVNESRGGRGGGGRCSWTNQTRRKQQHTIPELPAWLRWNASSVFRKKNKEDQKLLWEVTTVNRRIRWRASGPQHVRVSTGSSLDALRLVPKPHFVLCALFLQVYVSPGR